MIVVFILPVGGWGASGLEPAFRIEKNNYCKQKTAQNHHEMKSHGHYSSITWTRQPVRSMNDEVYSTIVTICEHDRTAVVCEHDRTAAVC